MEIGRLLERARKSRNISMAECAAEINTSRQRYATIERGSSFVNAVELERLFELLGIPLEAMLTTRGVKGGEESIFRDIYVSPLPGEIVRVVIGGAKPLSEAVSPESPDA